MPMKREQVLAVLVLNRKVILQSPDLPCTKRARSFHNPVLEPDHQKAQRVSAETRCLDCEHMRPPVDAVWIRREDGNTPSYARQREANRLNKSLNSGVWCLTWQAEATYRRALLRGKPVRP